MPPPCLIQLAFPLSPRAHALLAAHLGLQRHRHVNRVRRRPRRRERRPRLRQVAHRVVHCGAAEARWVTQLAVGDTVAWPAGLHLLQRALGCWP